MGGSGQLLIAKASVATAPGKSIVEYCPLLSRKPCCLAPLSTYNPTIWPASFILVGTVAWEPGKYTCCMFARAVAPVAGSKLKSISMPIGEDGVAEAYPTIFILL